jgi:hypothetical protein
MVVSYDGVIAADSDAVWAVLALLSSLAALIVPAGRRALRFVRTGPCC